ncbi:MAG: hypothetical protein PHF60_04365 [Candidatus ainarchaeum sp.]|nr:hypothetical protein [Candidatus ainarchaeum sp.]
MNATQTTRGEVSRTAQLGRRLRPAGKGNDFAGKEPQADGITILSSMLKRDPLANASRSNELCMQDFI